VDLRRRPGLTTALRALGVLVAAATLVGLAPGSATAAPRPSDGDIAAAAAAADAVTAQIRALSDELAAAQDAVDAAHAESALALDAYQATQAEYEAARGRADTAAAAAAQATADLGVARDELVAFARRSYMDGSSYPGAAALITATSPAELIERAALLEAAGAHRSDVLVEVTELQEQATEAETVARTSLAEADTLQQQAAEALTVAQAAETEARSQQAELATQETQLAAELDQAQAELRELGGAQEAADRVARATPPAPAPAPSQGPSAPVGNSSAAGAGSDSAVETAIQAAMAYLGTSYAWGGGGRNGPGPGLPPDAGVVGFDCSGLTQYAYAQAGISIPRNSRAQYSELPKVGDGDLRRGDLVFWGGDPNNWQSITHVAIYLGDNQVVQAPQSGDVVKVSAMWWRNYFGAVRPSA
jgi:cell wall-associated NlpC family hydrolase